MPRTEAAITALGRNMLSSHLPLPHIIPCSPGLIALHKEIWQAVGQAYIPLKQKGLHLVESSARPKGPAFSNRRVPASLRTLSGGCCDLLVLCPAEAHLILHCLDPALLLCHPWSLVPSLCSSPTLQSLYCRSRPCPGLSDFSILVEVRTRLFPGSCGK